MRALMSFKEQQNNFREILTLAYQNLHCLRAISKFHDLTSVLALDPSIKPPHRLKISALLRESLLLDSEVSPDGKAMLSIGVESCLVGLVALEEDLLDVRAVLRRAALVEIAESNANRRFDGLPLFCLGVGGMGGESGFDGLPGCQVSGDIASAKAIADRADLRDVVGGLDGVYRRVKNGLDLGHWVALLPVWEAVIRSGIREGICWNGIATEEVRHHDQVAGFGDAICQTVTYGMSVSLYERVIGSD